MKNQIIKTSDADWRLSLIRNYQSKKPFTFTDDAVLGIDPLGKSLLDILRNGDISPKELIAITSALGVAGIGAKVLRTALADPEPKSKIALAMIGATLILLPFGASWKLLTGISPGYLKIGLNTFEVKWPDA